MSFNSGSFNSFSFNSEVESSVEVTLNNVTLSPQSGWNFVVLAGIPDTGSTASLYEEAITDIPFTAVVSDVFMYEEVADLTYDSLTVPLISPPGTKIHDYKIWDTSLETYTIISSATWTDGGLPVDTTPPILSLPTIAVASATSVTGTVTTDEGNGLLYYYASTNASETAIAIKALGSIQGVVATGIQNVSLSGLTPLTTVFLHYVHDDISANESNVVSSTSVLLPEAVFETLQQFVDSLVVGSSTTDKLMLFLNGKGFTGGMTDMMYEYLKTKSSKVSHSERYVDWREGGFN